MKAAAARFIYLHINTGTDKDAWREFTKKYKPPGNGIPMLWIIKPNGDQAHSQMGARDVVQLLNKYGKELGKAVLNARQIGQMKTAAKEADALIEEGKFVSAYYKLSEFSEELKSDNKALTKVKATVKKIEEAAHAKIATAKELVESAKSDAKKLDGAFQLTVIAGSMSDCEPVNEKVQEALGKLKDDSKYKDLFKQADMLFEAREAAREEETAKAKKLYEKIIADFKSSEAAKRAKAKLEELEGGS